jgi:predicted secreted hydrolase
MHRRELMILLAGAATKVRAAAPGLQFPADFGAHPQSRTEWWYVTGSLQADTRQWGFQVTFFRSSTGIRGDGSSRFAASELVFAHAALTDLAERRLHHDQRVARSGFGIAQAVIGDTDVVLRDWRLKRSDASYQAVVASDSAGFALDLRITPTQAVLLQGDAGLSRKGPSPEHTSRYYSEPQLAVQGTLNLRNTPLAVTGRAWLDHEWSDAFLPPQAVGWDWIGMNLDDGSALTAFRLRRADGTSVYAGGSFRRSGETAVRSFAPDEVTFAPGRMWHSAVSKARYPVQWRVATPAGTFSVAALLDDQELDSRGSTGSIYWEGLSELLDESGKRIGRGYLEMTGYAATLRM